MDWWHRCVVDEMGFIRNEGQWLERQELLPAKPILETNYSWMSFIIIIDITSRMKKNDAIQNRGPVVLHAIWKWGTNSDTRRHIFTVALHFSVVPAEEHCAHRGEGSTKSIVFSFHKSKYSTRYGKWEVTLIGYQPPIKSRNQMKQLGGYGNAVHYHV